MNACCQLSSIQDARKKTSQASQPHAQPAVQVLPQHKSMGIVSKEISLECALIVTGDEEAEAHKGVALW